MRFMMMIKSDEQSEAGGLPDDEIVAAMGRYNDALIDAGVLVTAEGLHPSRQGARVKFHQGRPVVSDGPFAEAKEVLAGYWILQTKSKAEAIEWAKKVPIVTQPGDPAVGQIELRQIYELEDFPVQENESGWREEEAAARAAPPTPVAGDTRRRFLILRMADGETESGEMPGEALLTAMGAYNQELMNAGVMVSGEGLQPSAQGARVTFRGGKRTVTDGPFTEAKELIAGFTMIRAADLAEAIDWARRWPPLDGNGEAELTLRQIFETEDFGPDLAPELKEQVSRQTGRPDTRR